MSKSSDRRQAKREAALQYNPQIDALTSILGGLTADKKASVRQARTGARMTARSAKNALPEAKKIYRDALAGNTPGQKLIASEAAKLDSSSPFATAIKIETGGSATRLKEDKADTLHELLARRVDAVSGGQQEVRSIRQGYQADKAKTLDQLLGVTKQKGLYASTRYGDLRKDAAGRAVTLRGQTLSHQDRVASQKAAKEKAANDLSIKRGVDPVTGKALKKPKPPKTDAEKRAEKQHVNSVREKSGKALFRVKTAISLWDTWSKLKNPDTKRSPTPAELRANLLNKGYSEDEIHLALMTRANKPWDKAEIEAAHRLGIRVPREYLKKSTTYNATHGDRAN